MRKKFSEVIERCLEIQGGDRKQKIQLRVSKLTLIYTCCKNRGMGIITSLDNVIERILHHF